MERLVVDGFGKYVGRKGNRIIVKDGGSIVHQALPEELRQILVTGKGSIGFDAINFLSSNGVDIIFLNSRGQLTARLAPLEMRTVETRKEQYYAYKDARSMVLGKAFALAKIKNQYATLGTLAKRRKDTNPSSAEEIYNKREELRSKISEMEHVEGKNIESVRDTVMGIEGSASALYWLGVAQVIPEEFGFKGRSGRYAPDPVNAMLNYGYGILEGEVWRAVHFAGLDPYGGFLHADRPGKPSLVLDLMEEFRQQLIDKSVIKLISRKEVAPENFTVKENVCSLGDEARRTLLTEVLERFEEYVAVGDEKVRWCDLIVNQARKIGKYLRGEIPLYEGFFLRW
ncbi:CRISPR-associated endonuclease Cas1 [Candidatus Hecatella orcuttiae]|jgi:CRISPR-associated protein Cas1|uniref:CRISPR-associated endonuclease Cas1 n=1 Tax=Candidatus Hecatella orcuttiae TaxID=1935119 RepID=UPI002867B5D3|nr:CRISPR-associated endonuclease Cas1 [Candidatus Hecatella orcuttiae]